MRIALFMTYGMSLAKWRELGILDRELALYKEYQKSGHSVCFVSYGRGNESMIARENGFFDVVSNQWSLPTALYAFLIPYLFHQQLVDVDIFKTNQLSGAHVARRAASLLNKLLVVRQGFSEYEFQVRLAGNSGRRLKKSFRYERRELRAADVCLVTSDQVKEEIVNRGNAPKEKVFIVPNYMVPEIWSPPFKVREISNESLVVGVLGRLSPQKNLGALIQASAGFDVEIVFIGDGPSRSYLENLAGTLSVRCKFLGRAEQSQAVRLLSECDVFVLSSHFEGHPKALIEAMALGMPIIAADNPGIREFIKPGENALLVPGHVQGLKEGIKAMIEMPSEIRAKLGESARRMSLARYSVKEIATTEINILKLIT